MAEEGDVRQLSGGTRPRPAAARDAQTWSGMPGLRKCSAMRPELTVLMDEKGRDCSTPDARALLRHAFAATVLPEFDNLFAHADRSRWCRTTPVFSRSAWRQRFWWMDSWPDVEDRTLKKRATVLIAVRRPSKRERQALRRGGATGAFAASEAEG